MRSGNIAERIVYAAGPAFTDYGLPTTVPDINRGRLTTVTL